MNKSLIMKISYSVIASLVAVTLILNFSIAPVMASEVNSLPAYDIGVISYYDNDYVYVEDNGIVYSIPRDTVASGSTSNSYPWAYPNTLEVSALGGVCPVSYWYSPSNKQILVVSSSRTVTNANSTSVGSVNYCYNVRSYSEGKFRFYAEEKKSVSNKGNVAYITFWDCETSSRLGSKGVFCEASAKTYTHTLDDTYGSDYSDLMCVFSSYEIKGFFESNENTIITPDYYFKYQYLFYTEAKGYVFVDSSSPIDYISNDSDPTKAIIYFKEECNKHIYRSEMGNSWISSNAVSTMYGSTYSMDYSYFYDSAGGSACYTLVYCNDDDYEEKPIVTPEYGNINDVVSDLLNIVYIPNSGFVEEDYVLPDSKASVYEWFMYNSLLLNEVKFSFFDPDTGRLLKFEGMTIKGLFEQMFYELLNIKTVLNDEVDDLTLTVHNDLKSVFDNISVSNAYLYDIKSLIKDLPDYSASLNKTNGLLGTLNDNLSNLDINSPSNSGGGSSSTGITSDLLTGIYFEIDKLSDYFVPDNSTVVLLDDEQSSYSSFQDFLVTIDDDILSVLNDMSVDNDFSDSVSDSVVDNIVDDLYDDIVDEDIMSDLFDDNFVQNAVSSIGTGTLISGQFSNITLSGAAEAVPFVNATITGFYNASGWKVQSVLLLGATMFVVNVVVRKGV